MPSKFDKIPIQNEFLDRRTKLLPCQKEMVKYYYNQGVSITKLAKDFKVNKRLIQFLLFPERLEKNKKDRIDRGGWKQYYDKDVNTITIKEHRHYKNEILNIL